MKWVNMFSGTYSKSCQASRREIFLKIVNGTKPLIIFAKHFILDVWQGSNYAYAFCKCYSLYGKYIDLNFFHDGFPVIAIETSPLICRATQWTWQRILVGMDEMYEIVHQATYMFFGIDEVYKFVNLLRNLNMNTPEYALSQ